MIFHENITAMIQKCEECGGKKNLLIKQNKKIRLLLS
jgi:hypothetical protein